MRKKRNPDEHKRAAILSAAAHLFLKYGFSKTSMDAIAVRAKVTKQTVYSHFHSKDLLFGHIINELAIKHSPPLDLLKDKRVSIKERLYEIGLAFLNMVSSKEGIAATQLVIAEAYHHQKLAQHYYESGSRRILTILADYIASENKRNNLNVPVPMSAASYFFAMLKGNYYIRILLNTKPRPSPGEKEAHVRECVDIFMRLYGGRDAMRTQNVL